MGSNQTTLLEAFRDIGPADGDETLRARRREATSIILNTLEIVKRDKTLSNYDVDERSNAAMVALEKLINGGPRGARHGDPDSDRRVYGYLRRMVRNALVDFVRKDARAKRAFPVPSVATIRHKGRFVQAAIDQSDPYYEVAIREAEEEQLKRDHRIDEYRAWAETELFETILRKLSDQPGSQMRETVDWLRAIRDESTTVAEVLKGKGIGRSAFDKRNSNAQKRLYHAIESGPYDAERKEVLHEVRESLKLR